MGRSKKTKQEEPVVAETTVEELEAAEPAVVEEPAAEVAAEPVDSDLSATAKVVLQSLDTYIEVMDPARHVTVQEGVGAQSTLLTVFNAMLTLDGAELFEVHKKVVATIRKHRDGVFSDRLVYRFLQDVKLTTARRKTLERTLSLYLTAADVKSKADIVKVVDIEQVANSWEDPERGQVLTSLFIG